MDHVVLHSVEPFGDVSFHIDAGRVVHVHLGADGAMTQAPTFWGEALRRAVLGLADFVLPLDFAGIGPVHRAAMEAAMRIPPGRTATYGDLAAQIGRPRAARAVGGAMANNPFTLLVPCHRVVPKSGGLGSYGAGEGTRTKALLLEWEREEMKRLGQL